jgi:hypothetical protein
MRGDAACCLPSGLSPSALEFHQINRLISGVTTIVEPGRGLSPPVRTYTDPGARSTTILLRNSISADQTVSPPRWCHTCGATLHCHERTIMRIAVPAEVKNHEYLSHIHI